MKHDQIQHEYIRNSRKYYDDRFGRGDLDRSLTSDEQTRLDLIRQVLGTEMQRFADVPEPKILDFGCGPGWLADFLSSYGQVTAVDLSAEAVRRAQEVYPHVTFRAGDVTDPRTADELGPEAYDIIVSSEVLEHVLNQKGFFDNVFRLLKRKQGLLILTTPNGRWKDNWFHGKRRGWRQPYEFWMTGSELSRSIEGEFEEYRLRSFGSTWVRDSRSFGMVDVLGNRLLNRGLRALSLEPAYYRLLDRKGAGLYLLLVATR